MWVFVLVVGVVACILDEEIPKLSASCSIDGNFLFTDVEAVIEDCCCC